MKMNMLATASVDMKVDVRRQDKFRQAEVSRFKVNLSAIGHRECAIGYSRAFCASVPLFPAPSVSNPEVFYRLRVDSIVRVD